MKLFLKLTFAIIFFSITAVTSSSAASYNSYIIKFKNDPDVQTIQSLTADYNINISAPIKNIADYADNKSNRTLSSAQANLLQSLSLYRVVKFNDKNQSVLAAAEISADQRIESIEPNYIFSINEGEETGPDPRQKDQWSLKAVNAERAWEKASGKGIVVGVIDTGIDSEHPDLVNSLWINTKEDINGNGVFDPLDINGIDDDGNGVIDDVTGYDFVDQSVVNIGDDDTRDPFPNDEHSHGTLVSGVIAAQADNAIGIKGLAYDSKIMPLRAFDATGNGESDDIAAAIIYAAMQGANVINMSFGEAHASSIVEDAVKFAYESGCVLVASSGNNGWFYPHYPSDYKEVISVGASNEINERFSRSNYGNNLDLIAPGVNILSTYLNNQYRESSGTSFSAPHVSATAALLLELDETLTGEDVKGIVKTSATDLGDFGWDIYYGSGLLNIEAAVNNIGKTQLGFTSPENDIFINRDETDIIELIGSTITPMFESYEIHFGTGSLPKFWELLGEVSYEQKQNKMLAVLDLSKRNDIKDTTYTFKILVYLKNNNTIESRINVHIVSADSKLAFNTLKQLPVWRNNRKALLITAETNQISKFSVKFRETGSTDNYITISDQNRNAFTHSILLENLVTPGTEYEAIATAIRNDGTEITSNFTFGIEDEAFPESGFARKLYSIPSGYLNNHVADIYGNGKAAIALNDISSGTWGAAKIYEFDNNQFVLKETRNELLLPRDIGDSNGDGIQEVLTTVVLETFLFQADTKGGEVFSKTIWSDKTTLDSWAADFHDFTGDGIDDLITYGDTAFYIRSFVDGEYKLIATATDTDTNRYNSFGLVPGFAFGDFDNDGNQELCHSNRYGNMRIYQYENDHFTMEMIDTVDISGSEQYVCSADIDGDGIPEIVIGSFGTQIPFDNYDDGIPLWNFRIWKSDGANKYYVIWENHFHGVRGSSTYKNGLSSGNIDNKAGDEIIISLFPNLFVFKWDEAKQDMKPLWLYPASYANSAIVYDFDGNGVNEIGFTTFGNTSFYEYNTADMPSPPADLQAYAIDGRSAQLNWKATDDADSYEILEMTKTETGYTGKQIAVTNDTELLINNLSNNTHYEYVVRAINNSTTEKFSDISNFSDVYTHDPIFAELATVNNEHIIILEYSGALLPDNNIDRGNFELFNSDNEFISLPGTAQKANGAMIILTFDKALETEDVQLKIKSFPDYYKTPTVANVLDFVIPDFPDSEKECYLTNLEVLSSTELKLSFSEEMNKTDVEDIANYSLVPLSAVSSVELSSSDPKVANIYLNPNNPLSAVGKNYTLTVTTVKAVSEVPITKGAGNTLGFVFTADNPDAPFVYPNPVRMSEDTDIFFANIPAKATINILSLSGELLRTVTENDGNGGAEWDGRDRHGNVLKHGVYLYKVIQIRNDGSTVESGLNKFAVLP